MSFWSEWSDGKKWFMGILSALIIAALIACAKYLFSGDAGLPEHEVSFSASSNQFAISSSFDGTASVDDDRIVVVVDRAALSYVAAAGRYGGPRRLEDIRVSLAKAAADGSWEPIRRSEPHEVGRPIAAGDTMALDPFTATIDVRGLDSLAGYWLVFDIAETIPSRLADVGLSHAHTRRDLF